LPGVSLILQIMDNFSIRSPATSNEWDAYYDLRWRLLRAPWQQPRGSERDDDENLAYHLIAVNVKDQIIGVGRLHRLSETQSQLRYMAVETAERQRGVGKALVASLEAQASCWGTQSIVLNAREQAVAFYQACGYELGDEADTLFGVIRHWQMQKQLAP
jgi:N-acetylglutamate synthase-like GNAT family acetyltransferase